MSVDDWVRREAEKVKDTGDAPVDVKRLYYGSGIVHAFDALLSDEAIEAMQTLLVGRDRWVARADLHAAVEAAIRAVTEGESE